MHRLDPTNLDAHEEFWTSQSRSYTGGQFPEASVSSNFAALDGLGTNLLRLTGVLLLPVCSTFRWWVANPCPTHYTVGLSGDK
jgi:hypothetical protein